MQKYTTIIVHWLALQETGRTAVHVAVDSDDENIVRRLIGIFPDARDMVSEVYLMLLMYGVLYVPLRCPYRKAKNLIKNWQAQKVMWIQN